MIKNNNVGQDTQGVRIERSARADWREACQRLSIIVAALPTNAAAQPHKFSVLSFREGHSPTRNLIAN